MKSYIGLDLGGTKLLIGEVDAEGKVLASKKYKTGYLSQSQALKTMIESLEDYKATVGWKAEPQAIGVGVVGRVDPIRGIWLDIDPDRIENLPLCQTISDKFGLPCFMDNDVKSATRAEMKWGEGKDSSNFLYLNIGTGIAVGTVTGGQIVKGSHFNAGEVGHMHGGVEVGIDCCCGRKDCSEMIAAGVGIDACARLLKDRYKTELPIPENERVDVRDVYALCAKGDELCKVLVDNAATVIANLIMDMLRVTDPDTILLGGGIIANGGMLDLVMKKINPFTIRFVTGGIRLTQLNPEYIGLLGAAAVAMQ